MSCSIWTPLYICKIMKMKKSYSVLYCYENSVDLMYWKGLRRLLGDPDHTLRIAALHYLFLPSLISLPSSQFLFLSHSLLWPVNYPHSDGLTHVHLCMHTLLCRWRPIRSLCPRPSFWGVWHHEATRPGSGTSISVANRGPG